MSTVPDAGAASVPPPAAVPPQYTLKEGKHGSDMRVGAWSIKSNKRPILNGKEIDAAEKELCLPLPEMTFGNNSLTLTFDGGVTITFDAMGALRGVAVGEGWEDRVGGGVLVSAAEKWTARTSSPMSEVSAKPVRPHDWTFSTLYAGTVDGGSFEPSSTHTIPLALLARQDPVLDRILFYEDVSLFEDELHDNGESILHVRLRVMPHSLFILSRLFVRVDHVLFRIYDVRMFHEFGSGEVVRECTGLEAPYDDVKRHLEKPTDLSPLTDPNWVYQVLKRLNTSPAGTQAPSPAPAPAQAPAATGAPWATPAATTAPAPTTAPGTTAAPWAKPGAAPTAAAAPATAAPWATPAPAGARTAPTRPRHASFDSPSVAAPSPRKGKPWPGLGRRIEVLRLPARDTTVGSAEKAMEGMSV